MPVRQEDTRKGVCREQSKWQRPRLLLHAADCGRLTHRPTTEHHGADGRRSGPPGQTQDLRESPGLSKHKAVFRVPSARLFLSRTVSIPATSPTAWCGTGTRVDRATEEYGHRPATFVTTLSGKPDLATHLEDLSFSFLKMQL